MGLLKDTKKAADNMLQPKSKGKKAPRSDAWRNIGSGKGKSIKGSRMSRRKTRRR